MITQAQVMLCRCDKCGHTWVPRKADVPKMCPVCKRESWNEGSKQTKGGAE